MTARLVKLEQLRFLRKTALKLRSIADKSPHNVRAELLKLAASVDQEAGDLEVISLRGNGWPDERRN